jgi:hypothetical protein
MTSCASCPYLSYALLQNNILLLVFNRPAIGIGEELADRRMSSAKIEEYVRRREAPYQLKDSVRRRIRSSHCYGRS